MDQIFLSKLTRFPPAVVAQALRLHLETLILMLLDQRLATRQEVRRFLHHMQRQVLPDLE
jgi:hypothetical protein